MSHRIGIGPRNAIDRNPDAQQRGLVVVVGRCFWLIGRSEAHCQLNFKLAMASAQRLRWIGL
jgi:hypothetical protein